MKKGKSSRWRALCVHSGKELVKEGLFTAAVMQVMTGMMRDDGNDEG